MVNFKIPSLKKVTIGVIGAFFLIQILSILVTKVFPNVPALKGGAAVLLMFLAIGIMTLFIVGTNIEQLRKRETLIFVIIVFGLIGVAYWKLPEYIPEIFTIEPTISNAIKSNMASIVGGVS